MRKTKLAVRRGPRKGVVILFYEKDTLESLGERIQWIEEALAGAGTRGDLELLEGRVDDLEIE